MIKTYVAYRPGGRIAAVFTSDEPVTIDRSTGLPVVEAPPYFDADSYVDVGLESTAFLPMSASPITKTSDGFSGIPAPASVFVNGAEFRVLEPDVVLDSVAPGTYWVRVVPDDGRYPVWEGAVTL